MAGKSLVGTVKLTLNLQGDNWVGTLTEIETGRVLAEQTVSADSVTVDEWEEDLKTIPFATVTEVERFI